MSQDFKLKFDEMREGIPPDSQKTDNSRLNDLYDTPGNVRNLCFVWPDGKMKFMNYAYLVCVELDCTYETLTLRFTTESFKLKGFGLNILFDQLVIHSAKRISISDFRYKKISTEEFGITEAEII